MATEEQSSSAGWVNRFKSWLRKGEGLRYMASVHPCVINGVRHLVYKKRLAERNPHAFKCLQKYAEEHGFRLKEDQRSRYKPPRTDRRARLIPMLALSAGLLTQTVYAEPVSDGAEPIPNITVIGVQEAPERPYLKEKGKRFGSRALWRGRIHSRCCRGSQIARPCGADPGAWHDNAAYQRQRHGGPLPIHVSAKLWRWLLQLL